MTTWNKSYKFYNNSEIQTDKINPTQLFTRLPYLDLEILVYVSYDDLKTICKLDNYLKNLCKSSDLWRRKLELRYGEDILNYVKNNFKSMYKLLSKHDINICTTKIFTKNGNLEILKWLEKKGFIPDHYCASKAAENGHLEILKWLEKKGIISDHYVANLAAQNGHLEILEWLKKRDVYPTGFGADYVAGNGHLEILKWLEEYDILPNQIGANYASENGHLEVLKWLEERNVLPDQLGANLAGDNGHSEVLKWLEGHKICYDESEPVWEKYGFFEITRQDN